ncbi:hypothetical protein QOZ63_30925 [Pseudomonas aeruginosa]|uniref:hypothetical protein n=1 Tax=Pseudomonas aeruginosa TaxID=287 RepID=UPI00071B9021|nr:hypothetical protein [Pseudomonas aeruginosa]KSR07360.1 hypothetical protein APB35_25720 [Pseudomonas aeruginosa]
MLDVRHTGLERDIQARALLAVEKETVKAVIHLQASVKDTEVLRWLILKGLEEMTPEDLERFHKKRD